MTTNRTLKISSLLVALPAVAGVALLSSSALAGTPGPGNQLIDGCEVSSSNRANYCLLGTGQRNATMGPTSIIGVGNGWIVGVASGYTASASMKCTNGNTLFQIGLDGSARQVSNGQSLGAGNYTFLCGNGGAPIEAWCSANGGSCSNR